MSPPETPAPAPPAETEYGFSYGKGKLPLLDRAVSPAPAA